METNETARRVDPAIHVAPDARRAGRGLKTVTFALAMMAAGLATVAPASAQETGTITGTVEDAATGERVASAQISVPALGIGVLAGASGLFRLPDVPVGTHELRAERLGYAAASMNVTVTAGGAAAVEFRLEPAVLGLAELVVTGTAFSESLVQLPYAVAVSSRRTLAEQGSPQAVDFFRNLGSSAGVLGDRQGWYNTRPPAAVPETAASVNLRGIGPSRTLVLLNGRRQVYLPARLSGGRFVDVNAFPSIATKRSKSSPRPFRTLSSEVGAACSWTRAARTSAGTARARPAASATSSGTTCSKRPAMSGRSPKSTATWATVRATMSRRCGPRPRLPSGSRPRPTRPSPRTTEPR